MVKNTRNIYSSKSPKKLVEIQNSSNERLTLYKVVFKKVTIPLILIPGERIKNLFEKDGSPSGGFAAG